MENPFELILERLDRIEKAIEKNLETSIYGRVNRKQIPAYKRGKLYFKKF